MKTLILSGFGTNCEKETLHACLKAGAPPDSVHLRHINDIYGTPSGDSAAGGMELEDYHFLILIGGFLDGDDLGGGRACANRFRYRKLPAGGTFLDRLNAFVAAGRLVLGICNGFQLLSRLGLLLLPGEGAENGPSADTTPDAPTPGRFTVTTNAKGRFEDRWVTLRGDPASPCIFTRGIERIELPVRHGEGRVVGETPEVLSRLVESNRAPLRYAFPDGIPTESYPDNPNGSPFGIAALCNASGTVMGLMPHPEGFNHYTNHPRWTRRPPRGVDNAPETGTEDGDGVLIFRNAYDHLRGTVG